MESRQVLVVDIDGKKVNLTASLGVKFFNEDTDTPSTPGPYGNAGWTKDGKSVLIESSFVGVDAL